MASKQHSVEWKLKVGTEGGQEITALQKDLNTLGKIDSFAKLKKQTQDAEKAWQDATAKVATLARAISTTDAPTKKMASEFERAKKQAAGLKSEFEKTRLATNTQRKALADAGISTVSLSKAQAELKKRLQESARAAKESGAATRVAMADAAKSSNAVTSGNKSVASSATGLPPILSSVSGALGGVLAGYMSLQSGVAVLREIAAATLRAETSTYNLQSSVAAANKEFKGVGSVYLWEQAIKDLGDELKVYTDSELRGAVSRSVDMTKRLGLSFEQMREVVRRAADLGAGKTTLEDSVERVTAALRGEAEASEFLGLTLNEDYVKGQYAASNATGKLWKDLTDVEKALVRYKIMLEQSDAQMGRAAGTAGTLSGAWSEATANMENYVARSETTKRASENLAGLVRAAGDIAPGFLAGFIALSEGQGPISSIIAGYREVTGAANESSVAFSQTGEALRKLREMDAMYTAQYEGQSAVTSKGLAADVAAWKEQKWDDVVKAAQTALDKALGEEKKYSEQVKALAMDRYNASRSTEGLIRDLMRTTMTEGQAYQDKLSEARKTMSEAARLLAQGDAENAKRLYEESQRQFAQLGTEVKEGENVVVSSVQAVSTAMSGVQAAGQGVQDALKAIQAEAQGNLDKASADAQIIKDDIQSIKDAHQSIELLETKLKAEDLATPVLKEIQSEIAKIKDKTVTVHVRYVKSGDDGLATGGRVPGYAFGGRLPGYSRTDNMLGSIAGKRIIGLAGGEDVTNALSSRIIYKDAPWLLPTLNRVTSSADLRAVLEKIRGLADGGRAPRAVPDMSRITAGLEGLATGGRVVEEFRATFGVGGKQASMTTRSRAEFEGAKAIARELSKLQLVRGGQ